MNGYFCATPFHITAAITMQSGMFADEDGMLILLNHFGADEALVERIRSTGVFKEILVIENDYRTLWGNVKRALNVFFPVKPMRFVANKTAFSRFVCFALDYMDLAYIMQRYRRRGIDCAFSFGDDGIGTYIAEGIFKPKDIAAKLLRLCGRLDELSRVTRVYAYKPAFMVANTAYDVQPILQTEEACRCRREAVCTIWPLEERPPIDGGILYFEQPNEEDKDNADQAIEQAALAKATATLDTHAVVKMHPRSLEEEAWRAFEVLKTKMPYEVMLLQQQCAPAMMMTVSSTALFSTYLFDDLVAATCPSVLLYRQMVHVNTVQAAALDELVERINAASDNPCIFAPKTAAELEALLNSIRGDAR